MKKKLGAILAACLMACLPLVGCGRDNKIPEFKMPPGGFDTGKPVTIKFYHTMGQSKQKILSDYIKEFNKLYPNVTVDADHVFGKYEDVRDKIVVEMTTGDQPSLAYCYPDHVALYNEANAVLPLNGFQPDGEYKDMTVTNALNQTEPLGYSREQVDSFFEAYYNEGYQFGNGKTMYTLPLAKSTEVMYYNKTYFTANNIQVPTTWDELKTVCQTIKGDEEAGVTGIAPTVTPLGYDSEANWFITMCEQYGSEYTSATGKKYRFNNDKNKQFVSEFNEWYKKGYLTTQGLNSNSYTSTLFKEQKIYMCIGSSAGASYQMPDRVQGSRPFEVGIAAIPQVDPSKPKAISQGPSLCIFKKENSQEVLASWLFAKFLTTSIEFQAQFSFDSGYAPVIKTATENEIYQAGINAADGYDNLVQLAVKTCMANSSSYFTSPAFMGSSKARDEVGDLMLAVFAGKNINTAFKNAVAECEHFASSN